MISTATEQQVEALCKFSVSYFAAHYPDDSQWMIPEWYAEVILVLFYPGLMLPKQEIMERLKTGGKNQAQAIVFLDMTSHSGKLQQVKETGFNNFVGLMLALWAEVSKVPFFNICYNCHLSLRCLYPRVAFSINLSGPSTFEENVHSCLREANIEPRLCPLLKQTEKLPKPESTLSSVGAELFDILCETLLDEEEAEPDDEQEYEDEQEDKVEKHPASYELNMYNVPKFGNLSFLIPTVNFRRKTKQILKASGIHTKFFDSQNESDSSLVGLSTPTTISERLQDHALMMLPEDLYYQALLGSDEGMVPVLRGKRKMSISLTVYVDFSGSMIRKDANCLETAIAATGAIIDCFGPFGSIRVIPFSDEPIEKYRWSGENLKNGSEKWLAKLCRNEGTQENVLSGFAGTNIAFTLMDDFSRNAHLLAPEGSIPYMVLITDILDKPSVTLHNALKWVQKLGVAINVVQITSENYDFPLAPLIKLFKEYSQFQEVSYSDFEDYAPTLIQNIAKSYRSHLR